MLAWCKPGFARNGLVQGLRRALQLKFAVARLLVVLPICPSGICSHLACLLECDESAGILIPCNEAWGQENAWALSRAVLLIVFDGRRQELFGPGFTSSRYTLYWAHIGCFSSDFWRPYWYVRHDALSPKRQPLSACQSLLHSQTSSHYLVWSEYDANVESARTRQVASKWKIIRDCSVFPCFSSTSYDFSCFQSFNFNISSIMCSLQRCQMLW